MISENDKKLIEGILTKKDDAREKVLKISRTIIRKCSLTIIEIHRGEFKKATNNLKIIERDIKQMEKNFSSNQELEYGGNVLTAYQEYAEAMLLYYLITKEKLLSIKESKVEPIPYLLGLLDFVGELRRICLVYLIKGDLVKATEIFNLMQRIYEDAFSINHTSIIPGFRRKLDNTRRIVESTRGDIATDTRRISLERTIKEFENSLPNKPKKSTRA
jgi:translin